MQYRPRRIGNKWYVEKLDGSGLVPNAEFDSHSEAKAYIKELETQAIRPKGVM